MPNYREGEGEGEDDDQDGNAPERRPSRGGIPGWVYVLDLLIRLVDLILRLPS
jgi:hypothetical protein